MGTRLHRVDARGGGILQEMAHKVNCFWGCSRSEYLVGEGREREREREEGERERERGQIQRENKSEERSWKSIKPPRCALFNRLYAKFIGI